MFYHNQQLSRSFSCSTAEPKMCNLTAMSKLTICLMTTLVGLSSLTDLPDTHITHWIMVSNTMITCITYFWANEVTINKL